MKITVKDQIKSWLPEKLIARRLHHTLLESLELPEITVLYGPRQVGKSIEVAKCIDYLLDTPETEIFYFNLDYPEKDLTNPESFISLINGQRKSLEEKAYVFLDEAQRLDNIGLFVKYIYDRHLGIKFFLTGSASLEIKQKIKEPLTGRKIEFFLSPLDLLEILEHRGINIQHLNTSNSLAESILEEYLIYGGYPAVVTLNIPEDKQKKLQEISDSYVVRDVFELFNIRSQTELRTVAIYLAQNNGGILSKEGLSRLAGVSKYEIDKIINALEKSFIMFLVRPFAKNPLKELVHRPKAYYVDLGIRNALLQKLEAQLLVGDKGSLFENTIAIQLKNIVGLENLKYWRTKNQTEVDFVTVHKGGRLKAWETKYNSTSNTSWGLQTFKDKYSGLLDGSLLVTKSNYWQALAG